MKHGVLCFLLLVALMIVAQTGYATSPAPAPAAVAVVPKTPPSDNAEQRDYRRPVCMISGKVTALQAVEKTPWRDDTPTTLTVTEVHITVALDSRKPQRANVSPDDCPLPASGITLYKLCSPTQLKLGDNIAGTEGLATGSDSTLGCLFDVAVAPSNR